MRVSTSQALNKRYLAVAGGLASGASTCYIPERGISIGVLQRDIMHLCGRYKFEIDSGIPREGRIILRTENASSVYVGSCDLCLQVHDQHGE